MTQAEFMTRISRCIEKAFLDTSWVITSDEDEVADICVDRSGRILLQDKPTKYNVKQAVKIKYGIDSQAENYYILISFSDGSTIRFGNFKERKYIVDNLINVPTSEPISNQSIRREVDHDVTTNPKQEMA